MNIYSWFSLHSPLRHEKHSSWERRIAIDENYLVIGRLCTPNLLQSELRTMKNEFSGTINGEKLQHAFS